MKNNKIIFLSYSIIIIIILSYFFISKQTVVINDKTATEVIAVIDIKKALTQHPEYKQLETLKNALTMVEQYSEFKFKQEESLGADFALTQEKELAISNHKRELQKKFLLKEEDLTKEIKNQLEQEKEKVNASFNPEIFNIHLKFKTLNLGEPEKEVLSRQLQKLLLQRDAEFAEIEEKYKLILKQKKSQLNNEQKLAEEDYLKQVEVEYKNKPMLMNEPSEYNQNKELKESKRVEIENLKVKIKKLEEHLISEVKDEVVNMAITRKITIVMDKVFLNITAIDLTDDIIAELKRKNN